MEFKEAVEFIYGLTDYERFKRTPKFDLSSFEKFLSKFGSPQKEIKRPILVTGTKGKGSTVHFIESILSNEGKTGVFTSPHLIDIRERIRFNKSPISEESFVEKFLNIKPYITEERTVFEILTSISFLYFQEKAVDFSLYEVGLGGRLDSTNVLCPEVSVITPISFDHMDILGNTLESITREKCGIIRENSICISAPQDPIPMAIIREDCKNKRTILNVVGEDIFCENVHCGLEGSFFEVDGKGYFIPLIGRHQVINALTAMLAARALGVSQRSIEKGLLEAKCEGRLQIIWEKPFIVIDGAHNRASMSVLMRGIREFFNYKKLFLVFAALSNKDIKGMVEILSPIVHKAFITKVESERAKDPYEIVPLFKEKGIPAEVIEYPNLALKKARKEAQGSDLILVTGSFYLVGEILKHWKEGMFRSEGEEEIIDLLG